MLQYPTMIHLQKSKTGIFLSWLKGYFKLLVFALTLMFCLRWTWLITYKQGNELNQYSTDLINAFILGFRFDLSALCYLTLLSFVLWLMWFALGSYNSYSKILRWQRILWVNLLTLLGIILYADYIYYGFFQDHFNALILGFIQDDTLALLKTFWKNYPLVKIFLFTAIGVYLLNKWLKRNWDSIYYEDYNFKLIDKTKTNPKFIDTNDGWAPKFLIILFFVFSSLGARGTLGLFPLEIMHTAISANPLINALSFNGAHALVRALQLYKHQRQKWNENLIQLGYQQNELKAYKDFLEFQNQKFDSSILYSDNNPYLVQKTNTHAPFENPHPHVIVVLMESWGSDWISKQTSQLDLLGSFKNYANSDLFTPYIFPSSMATIGSLGSLTVDLPQRFYSPFLTESSFLGVPFTSAPARVFQEQGYQTHFVYGGNLGWRSIDQFLPRQGFQNLHGDHLIKRQFSTTSESLITHDWGVYDQYVFDYAFELLSKAKTPQFIFVLTTSNHPPYTIPENYHSPSFNLSDSDKKSLIGEHSLAISRLKAFQYSNDQLGIFLDRLKNNDLDHKTLVMATGDHSFYINQYDSLDFFEKWCVPLYISLPQSKVTKEKSDTEIQNNKINLSLKHKIGTHIDVFPTLYNLIFSNFSFKGLGQNLLDPNYFSWAFHTTSWTSFDDKQGIILSPKGEILNSLCRTVDELNQHRKYELCPRRPEHEQLRKRVVSLMGVSDFIFENERKRQAQPKN